MKFIDYGKHIPDGKEIIELPSECVAYYVKSCVPLVKVMDDGDFLGSWLSLISFDAISKLLFWGIKRKKDHYILCSFNEKLIKDAISLLEKETEEKIEIIKKYEKDEVFDDKERIGSYFLKENVKKYHEDIKEGRKKREKKEKLIRKKKMVLNLLVNGSKKGLKTFFELLVLGSTLDEMIDKIDEDKLKGIEN